MAILSLSSFMNPVSYHRPCSSKLMINPSSSSYICSSSISSSRNHHQVAQIAQSNNYNNITRTKCELKKSAGSGSGSNNVVLGIGSPIIVIEAPKMLKTAASVPCLRANSGLVKPGDVGRIVSRKPKDVWAVRLSIGTYLIDGRYFKPLDLDL